MATPKKREIEGGKRWRRGKEEASSKIDAQRRGFVLSLQRLGTDAARRP